MRYRLFGHTGLRVSEVCLGAMTFGSEWGWGADRAESRRIFDGFAAAGGNFIDTANHYTGGTSEKYLGEFIKSERHRYVVAEIALELGRTPVQVALAWLLQRRPGGVIPILGARSLAQLQDNLGSLDCPLEPAHQERLDAVSAIALGFPHDFLAQPLIRRMVHGDATIVKD
jgi:aryl-alcohol dehydrogenase-like predicted oxidoreductase